MIELIVIGILVAVVVSVYLTSRPPKMYVDRGNDADFTIIATYFDSKLISYRRIVRDDLAINQKRVLELREQFNQLLENQKKYKETDD